MLIEYTATRQEDDKLFAWMEKLDIKWTEAFNPEDYYYVLETEDTRVVTMMTLMNIEIYASGEKISGASANL